MQRDPFESAEAAGLRYVSDTMPGIRRKKSGSGFNYVGPDSRTIKDPAELNRIRIGNDEYARSSRSFGLTTLRERHVEISGSNIRFEFRGKSGKAYNVSLNDRRLARIVQRCQEIPGEDLFQYLDGDGVRQTVGSGDVNDYLRTISGQEFTAKDFRTWAGTKLAVAALTEIGAWTSQRQAKSNILRAIDRVAEQLNNTRAVCRKYYVHPAVFDAYTAGTMLETLQNRTSPTGTTELDTDEAAVAGLLRHQLGIGIAS